MNDQFVTSLYLFSALLQADATLIGLGAIFIIYKLQTLDSQFTFTVQDLKALGYNTSELVKKILLTTTKEEKADILKKNLTTTIKTSLFFIATIDSVKIKIKKMIILPVLLIGSHLIFNAVFIWTQHFIKNINIFNLLCWLNILWFILSVIASIHLIYNLILSKKTSNLKTADVELYNLIYSNK